MYTHVGNWEGNRRNECVSRRDTGWSRSLIVSQFDIRIRRGKAIIDRVSGTSLLSRFLSLSSRDSAPLIELSKLELQLSSRNSPFFHFPPLSLSREYGISFPLSNFVPSPQDTQGYNGRKRRMARVEAPIPRLPLIEADASSSPLPPSSSLIE